MITKKKVTISWSGGKDSALALYKILASNEFDVVNLHTVIDQDSMRVGLHGIHESLVEKQAERIGLPLKKIYLPASNDHDVYQSTMQKFYRECAGSGIEEVVFGDIFLEDLRAFRMALLDPEKLTASFPLWKVDSKVLVNDFINIGFKTIVCAANANFFSPHQMTLVDRNFFDMLPAGVDPCGENGEFHTFVFDGPLFKKPIRITIGEVVKKSYAYQTKEPNGEIKKIETSFWFRDLF